MIIKIIKTILIILIISGTGMPAKAQDWAGLKRYQQDNSELEIPGTGKYSIVFMGNSITEGWLKLRPGYFAGKNYINRGISGQTTPQMLLRFRQDVIDLNPSAVVILAGTNDIAGNTGPSTIEMITDNIFSMAELARAHNIKVFLCSVLPASDFPWRPGLEPAEKIVRLNTVLKAYAEENKIVYVDFFSAMANETKGMIHEYGRDGVHPNEAGYMLMEGLLEEAINRVFTPAGQPEIR